MIYSLYKVINVLSVLFILILISACTMFFAPDREYIPNVNNDKCKARDNTCNYNGNKIAVFFDGTNNSPDSDTNIKQLHSIISLQDRTDIQTIYIEGVGSKGTGLITGWGIGRDVRNAYKFIIRNYESPNKTLLYFFGFSRGAYSARILSDLIYYQGIPKLNTIAGCEVSQAIQKSIIDTMLNPKSDISKVCDKSLNRFVNNAFNTFKGQGKTKEERSAIQWNHVNRFNDVSIRFMGVWDTVETLGIKGISKSFVKDKGDVIPNDRYGHQLCNVEHAAHAVSIDDNRSTVFALVPMVARESHRLYEQDGCKRTVGSNINEVYFSGAHADVGGGYSNTYLNGISMNWMLSHIRKIGDNIIPDHARVPEDKYGISNDPTTGFVGAFYPEKNRDIFYYLNDGTIPLTLHQSVTDRLELCGYGAHEFDWRNSPYGQCFTNYKEQKRSTLDQRCFGSYDLNNISKQNEIFITTSFDQELCGGLISKLD